MKKFKFTIQGNAYEVEIQNIEDNVAEIEVNGSLYKVEIQREEKQQSKTPVLVRKPVEHVQSETVKKTHKPADKIKAGAIKAPLPGTILQIKKKVGDEVKMNGPYGDFQLSQTTAPIVFIAGGSGMAPIKCILHHMKNSANNRKATYYFGANQVNELFLLDIMKKFESDYPQY